jgi:hypothetical protein
MPEANFETVDPNHCTQTFASQPHYPDAPNSEGFYPAYSSFGNPEYNTLDTTGTSITSGSPDLRGLYPWTSNSGNASQARWGPAVNNNDDDNNDSGSFNFGSFDTSKTADVMASPDQRRFSTPLNYGNNFPVTGYGSAAINDNNNSTSFNPGSLDTTQVSGVSASPDQRGASPSLSDNSNSSADGSGSAANNNGISPTNSTQGFRHACNKCDKSFKRSEDLRRHYRKHFPGTRVFPCNVPGCDKNGENGFYRRDKLMYHRRSAHPTLFSNQETSYLS